MGKFKKNKCSNVDKILEAKISKKFKTKCRKELKKLIKKQETNVIFDESLVEKIKYTKKNDHNKIKTKKTKIKDKKLKFDNLQVAATEKEWNVSKVEIGNLLNDCIVQSDIFKVTKTMETSKTSRKKKKTPKKCEKINYKEINMIIGDSSEEVQSEEEEEEEDHIEIVLRKNYVSVLEPTVNFVDWNNSAKNTEKSNENNKKVKSPKVKSLKKNKKDKKRKLEKEKCTKTNKKQNINTSPENIQEERTEVIDETSECIDNKLKNLSIDQEDVITQDNDLSKKNCEFYLLNDECIVILKHPTKLYFNGVLKASALLGKVEVLGYVLTRKPQLIYSLRGSSFLCFETLESSDEVSKTDKNLLATLGLKVSVIDSLSSSDCILKLERYTGHKISFINHYIEQNIIPHTTDVGEMEDLLKCRFATDDMVSLYNKSFEWDSILQSINENPHNTKIVLCGGKSVGKSTLFRYIVNQLLPVTGAVLGIDLDIGQSEFFVPGCISVLKITEPLLGPNYSHIQKTDRSYLIGSVNVTNCLNRYFDSVENLISYCRTNESFNNIPWVMNTMGFVRGLGNDIMTIILRMLQPTHVVQINSEHANSNYEQFMEPNYISNATLSFNWKNLKQLSDNVIYNYDFFPICSVAHTLPSKKDTGWQLHPKELRNMNVYSYLSDIVKNEDECLLEVKPYVIKLNHLKLVSLNLEINEALLPCAFSGSFVALCSAEECDTTTNMENPVESSIKHNMLYRCIGFGIVRGIDDNDVYVLTPLSLDDLNCVNYLVTAAEPLPADVYMKTKYIDHSIPYISTSKQIRTTLIPKKTIFNINKVKLLEKMNSA